MATQIRLSAASRSGSSTRSTPTHGSAPSSLVNPSSRQFCGSGRASACSCRVLASLDQLHRTPEQPWRTTSSGRLPSSLLVRVERATEPSVSATSTHWQPRGRNRTPTKSSAKQPQSFAITTTGTNFSPASTFSLPGSRQGPSERHPREPASRCPARSLRQDNSRSDGAPAASKATSTASKCSNARCTDAPIPTCSAAASCSPTDLTETVPEPERKLTPSSRPSTTWIQRPD